MRYPSYLNLYQSGELKSRVGKLKEMLSSCEICPHECHIDRFADNSGFCESYDYAYVCSYCDHHGEEPPLSGIHGSGTIFFGRCNLQCVFCQNSDISQHLVNPKNYACTTDQLTRIMLYLQNDRNCHNINFVSPSHFIPQIVEAVYKAIPMGLNLPLVYNSNGYDKQATIRLLDGIIDIYLPDLKYADNDMALKYSGIENYVETARTAVKEMFRQTGLLLLDKNNIALKGLIIRHLVLPDNISGSMECLQWIAEELSPEISLSLMAQYYPANRASEYPELSNSLNVQEYYYVLQRMKQLNFTNALYQEIDSANIFRPDFNNPDDPFKVN